MGAKTKTRPGRKVKQVEQEVEESSEVEDTPEDEEEDAGTEDDEDFVAEDETVSDQEEPTKVSNDERLDKIQQEEGSSGGRKRVLISAWQLSVLMSV